MRYRQRLAVIPVWLVLAAFTSLEALFAPRADLWDVWAAHDPASVETVDHGAWNGFLAKYVTGRADGGTGIDYARVEPADRQALDRYVARMAEVRVAGLTRAEQKAYWINLYNSLTLKIVLDHWPVASILDIDISPGLFADGPWGKKVIAVAGHDISLNDIEHRILRPIWRDARVHYAVNCASIGCPDLAPRAYTADNLEDLLEAGARAYVNSARGVRFNADGTVAVSKIYTWFAEDFGGSAPSVLAHIRQYAEGDGKRRLLETSGIAGYFYDWSINVAGGKPSR